MSGAILLLPLYTFTARAEAALPLTTITKQLNPLEAGPSGHAGYGVGLRPLAYWDFGSNPRRGHGSLSVVSVMRCHIEECAKS